MLPMQSSVKENWWVRANIQNTQKQIEQEYFWQLRGGRVGSMAADLKSTIFNNKQPNDQK